MSETETPSFERDGFCTFPEPVVEPDVLATAQAGMARVRDGEFNLGRPPSAHPGYDPSKLCKINDAHLADHGLYGLLTQPPIGALAAQVTGGTRIQVWASQLLIKPRAAATAGNVGWHQDRQYWGYWQRPEGLFTIWIALSDVAADCGPMRFVRGSHRWGFLDQGDFFGHDQAALREQIEVPEGEVWEESEALLGAGGVSFHHSLTYHGSGPNRSDRPRCSVAVHLRTEAVEPCQGVDNLYVSHLDDATRCPVIFEA
jgi:ectoine hydroxylase-related dioxygenase (phytanoyl-CoA dioxygenase family)